MAFRNEGAVVSIIAPSPRDGNIKGWKEKNWGEDVPVDLEVSQAREGDFDALLLPGGVMNPDRLRTIPEAVAFVRDFFRTDKIVAAICHGPQMLIEADAVRGRMLTSWPSLKTDLKNAGAEWVDREVVMDGNLITSRTPDDLPAFMQGIFAALAEPARTQS